MSKELIIWPGQSHAGMSFSPGGIALSREGATIPTKSKAGNGKIQFLPVHLPSSWEMQMMRAIEQKAHQVQTLASDFYINAPFTIINGELVITQEIIEQFASEITIIEACTAEIGIQTLPSLTDTGALIHIQKEVMTVTTYGKVVMHIDVKTGMVVLAFDIELEVEQRFENVEITELVAMAKQEVITDHFRIGGVIVFPKVRRGSTMVPKVLGLIEATFTQTNEIKEVAAVNLRAW